MQRYSGGVAALALCLAAVSVGAESGGDWSAGLLYQDNVTRADRSADRESDMFAQVEAGADWFTPLGLAGSLRARAFAGAEQAFTFADLSQLRAGAEGAASYKIGLGPFAPRVDLRLAAEHGWFEQDDRSRWLLQPALHLRKRVSEPLEVELFIRHERAAAEADLFDSAAEEGGVSLRWTGEGPWSAIVGYRLRSGDVVAYATPPRADLLAEADLVVVGEDTFDRPLNGYRLDARAHRIQVGAGYAVGEQSVVEVQYEWQETRSGDLRYDDHLVHVGLRHAF